ncbi:disease resistance protein RPV1-like, partial [Lotus japonicus]|uniref:disease resistance protein RPV1-like n=1 Tax=Lotus japonicus TaxID=34305 RepID=UPI002589ED91
TSEATNIPSNHYYKQKNESKNLCFAYNNSNRRIYYFSNSHCFLSVAVNLHIDMASSSSLKKHEVFISFRGEDTRPSFISFLHAALCRTYIETYIDYRIDKEDEVCPQHEKAIRDSTLFLLIFSENYASSTCCLNELAEIIKCKRDDEDIVVIPVFYKIEPSQVRKQSGSYHTAFAKHKKQGKDKIQKWKDALFEASNFSGFDSTGYRTESDLIEDIIKTVLRKLNQKYTNELRCLFIPDENYSRIESSLETDSSDVRIIGLWGMGGIGKTSLAAAIFQKVSSQYEGSCFLENVTEESNRRGLNYTCNRLLSKLLKEDLGIDTPKVIPAIVMRRLRRTKSFIVLDDVSTSQLLESLIGAGRDWLGAGSRVIVTTRDKHVLLSGGVDEIHEVKEMNLQNSLRLFSLNAFNQILPKQEYEEVSNKAVAYAKGNPLALKVLGSFLRSKTRKEWDSALAKLKEIPNADIQKVLRLSYDDLDDTEQNIFLDIACFFKGSGRKKVTKILNACGFFADIGIRNLLDKALITISSYNVIQMHDLLQEMGREIVHEESVKNPGQRSRLWDPQEVCDVLTNDRGTGAVEGIVLDMSQITPINLSSEAFKSMWNLRVLAFEAYNRDVKRINSVNLPTGLDSLPKELRCFAWRGYPLNSLPSAFRPEKLVELHLPYSNVEKLWNGAQNLPSLERIDLSECTSLTECPNLSRAPNVKHVVLGKCESLTHVDPSIFTLQKLVELDVSGCKSLKSLSCSSSSPSLRRFYAWGCFNLQEFTITSMPSSTSGPSTTGLSSQLEGSCLKNEVPSSSSHIRNLELFSFPICESLKDLPENLAYQITLSDSGKNECDTLITLHKVLPSPCFRHVRRVFFFLCHTLSELPDNISLLSSLEYLGLFFSAIRSLPESIKYLPRLKFLELGECKMIQSIPALPQSIECFFVWNSESLQNALTSVSEPSKKPDKCTFLLPNCIKLDQPSFNAILKDAIFRIELGAEPMSAEVLEKREDASSDDEDDNYNDLFNDLYISEAVRSGKICYLLPAGNCEVGDWFHYHSTQALATIELPPNHSGFIFFLVLSQVQTYHIGYRGSFGCEFCLETSWGEMIIVKSFFVDESIVLNPHTLFDIMSDHVFLWYDAKCCQQIREAIKEIKAKDGCAAANPKLAFKFFARTQDNMEAVIKECGFRWIYSSEDQIVEEGEECESETCGETHRGEGSDCDEQKETVTPIKTFKQSVLVTSSNLEAEGTEHLRQTLEELLHIGFGGDLMQ